MSLLETNKAILYNMLRQDLEMGHLRAQLGLPAEFQMPACAVMPEDQLPILADVLPRGSPNRGIFRGRVVDPAEERRCRDVSALWGDLLAMPVAGKASDGASSQVGIWGSLLGDTGTGASAHVNEEQREIGGVSSSAEVASALDNVPPATNDNTSPGHHFDI